MNHELSSPVETTVIVPTIGVVESPYRTVSDRCDYASEARVRIRDELVSGLRGLEHFSHIWVIYHQHCAQDWLAARGWEPRGPLIVPADDERAGQGIFSLRAPCRPACLGSSIVELVRREGAVLVVRGLDAIDGTPVLDVKPYVPQFDAFPCATVPTHWARVMDRPDDPANVARAMHWDTSNVDFALGMRVGLAALRLLRAARSDALRARVSASAFFAHGFEMATGCSALRGTLHLTHREPAETPWRAELTSEEGSIVLEIGMLDWPDAAAVMAASNARLFTLATGVEHR